MPPTLKRRLGFWDSVAINVGIMVGIGIFRVPSEVARYIDSPAVILAAWTAGGGIAFLGSLCYGELSSQLPETGGTYVFLRESWGKLVGFLFGWIEISVIRAASIAGVAFVFSAYLSALVPAAAGREKTVAILAIMFFAGINAAGLEVGAAVQKGLSMFKILTLFLLAALVFWFVPGQDWASRTSALAAGNVRAAGMVPALIPILWTYGGWHESTFLAGEFRDTKKELPQSLLASVLVVAGLYVLINAAYLAVLPPSEMSQHGAVASEVFERLFGASGSVIVSVSILIFAGGALNSTVLTGARIPFAVASDYPAFAWLGKVHERFETPVRSLVLNSLWACFLVLFGTFERLLFFSGFAVWLFFALTGLSVFILRRKKRVSARRLFEFGSLAPLLFVIVSAWLFWNTVQHAPRESFFGGILLLCGIPLYLLLKNRSPKRFSTVP